MFNKNRQPIRSPVSAFAKKNPFISLFFKEMSRIGKNEATFKFVRFLISTGDSVRVRNFRLESFFPFLSTSGRWSVSPLTEFADVAAGAPDFRQQKKMDSSCEIDVVTYSSKENPKKEKHVNRCVFLFQKVCVSSSIIMIFPPNFYIFARYWESTPKVQIRFMPHSVRPLNDSSTVAATIAFRCSHLLSLMAKCYSLVHLRIEWMYFVNDFGATTKNQCSTSNSRDRQKRPTQSHTNTLKYYSFQCFAYIC